jgi:hypothetical protein
MSEPDTDNLGEYNILLRYEAGELSAAEAARAMIWLPTGGGGLQLYSPLLFKPPADPVAYLDNIRASLISAAQFIYEADEEA